jgi:Asp-tRNA(Asn)/Glu-tRNA(Gln) amidotransferase B subunit
MRVELYDAILGVEAHVALNADTKLWCPCRPMSGECPVCRCEPGALPVVQPEPVRLAVQLAALLNCRHIAPVLQFDRKHYLSWDAPRGYQITQYHVPIGRDGQLTLPGSGTRVRIDRVQLEEDLPARAAGSLVWGRSGRALAEIVTGPCLRRETFREFYSHIRNLLLVSNISECRGETADLRIEPNVSIQRVGDSALNVAWEVKGSNSPHEALAVIREAMQQQILRAEGGEPIRRWTLHVARSTAGGTAAPQRSSVLFRLPQGEVVWRRKLSRRRYCFMPETRIPPVVLSRNMLTRRRFENLSAEALVLLSHPIVRKLKMVELMWDWLKTSADSAALLRFLQNVLGRVAHDDIELATRITERPPTELLKLVDAVGGRKLPARDACYILRMMLSDAQITFEKACSSTEDSKQEEVLCAAREILQGDPEFSLFRRGEEVPPDRLPVTLRRYFAKELRKVLRERHPGHYYLHDDLRTALDEAWRSFQSRSSTPD